MKVTHTPTEIIVEPTPHPCPRCGTPEPTGFCGMGVCVKKPTGLMLGNPTYKPEPRMPATNGQRFVPGGRGPCRCSEAAVLDKITGLCTACWRVLVLR